MKGSYKMSNDFAIGLRVVLVWFHVLLQQLVVVNLSVSLI